MAADDPTRMTTAALLDVYDRISNDRVHGDPERREREGAVLAEVGRRLRHAVLIDGDREAAERNTPSATSSIEHAKLFVRAHRSEGLDCPVCYQFVKLYRRKLNRNMAAGLLLLYRVGGTEFTDTSKLSGWRDGERQKLRYWDLIEAPPSDERSTWRVTDAGVDWLAGRRTVLSHALIYNGSCEGLDGTALTFPEAYHDPFDLAELMAERPFPPPSDPSPRLFD